jgi:hypothetical protein
MGAQARKHPLRARIGGEHREQFLETLLMA